MGRRGAVANRLSDPIACRKRSGHSGPSAEGAPCQPVPQRGKGGKGRVQGCAALSSGGGAAGGGMQASRRAPHPCPYGQPLGPDRCACRPHGPAALQHHPSWRAEGFRAQPAFQMVRSGLCHDHHAGVEGRACPCACARGAGPHGGAADGGGQRLVPAQRALQAPAAGRAAPCLLLRPDLSHQGT